MPNAAHEGARDCREPLDAILRFLRAIGLSVDEASLPDDTFLPGVAIQRGTLVVDRARLRWPGDVLHEAGHLAVLPAALRGLADGDAPEQGVADGGEAEAMAWAWAANSALGLPPDVLLHEGGYQGRAAALVGMHAVGIVPGLRGLCSAGLARAEGFPGPLQDRGDIAPYPHLHHWLRP